MNYQKRYYQEFASVTPTYTSFYRIPLEKYEKYSHPSNLPKQKRVDNRSIRRLQKALNYLLITSPIQTTYCKEMKKHVRFKLNFITLTLSDKQIHDDEYFRVNLLDRFLKWLVYKGATGYVWKAETQKNGNIHFHITSNKYIHWKDIRSYWNALQFKHGYLANYLNTNGHTDANSTDIHAIKNEEKAMKYMSKYMLKEQKDRREIDGRNFGYSRNLANIKLNFETTSKEYEQIHNYLTTLKPNFVAFDFISVMWHDIINLNSCPSSLAKMIVEQVAWKPSKQSKHSQ